MVCVITIRQHKLPHTSGKIQDVKACMYVLVCLYISVIKHWPKSTWGRKCLFHLRTSKSQSVTEGKQGRNSGRCLHRNQGEMLCSDLLHLAYTPTYIAQATCLGLAPPTVGCPLRQQLAIKKMFHRHSHRSIWWRQFFNWISVFQSDSSLCQVDKN